MSTPRRPLLKSLPASTNHPGAAEPTPAQRSVGVPKIAAEGVRTAVGPDPHALTVAGIRPGLDIRNAGSQYAVPVADWLCACGHHKRARGRDSVNELTTRARVGHCPHAEPATDSRRAAA